MFTVVREPAAEEIRSGSIELGESTSLIDDIVREGARRMLAEALQAEVDAYVAQFSAERDERGRRLVVCNGCHQPREVLTSAGVVEVVVPRVNDRRVDPDTGDRVRFSSAILPPWCRIDPEDQRGVAAVVLHGLSTSDFGPALGQFLGSSAGLSAPVITKLTQTWQTEQRTFAARDLSEVDYVYLWADGIHVNIRLEEHKLCLLVMIGVRADGRKELVALTDGYRESTPVLDGSAARLQTARHARAPRSSRSATVRSGSGGRYARCSPRPGSNAAGSTRSQAFSVRYPKVPIPARRRPSRTSGTPRIRICPRRGEGLRRRLRGEVPPRHHEDHQRPRGAAEVL